MKLEDLALIGSMGRMSSKDGDKFSLDLQDENSGRSIVEIEMTPEQFAGLITGKATRLKAVVHVDERIGKTMESMEIYIDKTKHDNAYDGEPWQAFLKYARQVVTMSYSGWELSKDEKYSGHHLHGRKYKFTIRRWV